MSPNTSWSDPLGILEEKTAAPPAELTAPYEKLRAQAGPRGFTFAGRVVTDPNETPEEALKRTPLGELESAGRTVTGAADIAAGLGLAKLATTAAVSPRQTGRAVVDAFSKFPEKWRDFWQNIGENVTSKLPSSLRAGRGTPLEFREARFQMEADIANRAEQAIALGENLKANMTLGERLRADQLLRGGITTAKTPQKLIDATTPARAAINEIQDELIKLGRLSPETVERFQENFGPYLARLYASKEFNPVKPVFLAASKPIRAGTERLLPRGDRVEIEIPSLEREMKEISKLIGPESEFRREFRNRARELATRKETTTTTASRTETLGEKKSTQTSSSTEGGPGEYTKIPLSGAAAKLEEMVEGALVYRGMTAPEAKAAIGRVKAAAVKTAQAGPEVEITGGGTTRETVKETIERTTRETRETVKQVIENLGINKGQQAALHAYYDAISRAGAKAKTINIGGQQFKINPIMDANSAAERVEALDDLLRAGFRVEARNGNKVKLFRDIPEDARKAMGELRSEPGYVAGKSIAQAGKEVAVTRFFQTVANNPEWASPGRMPGWVQMPSDKKRLADLAGKWVRPDIAAEINESIRMRADWERVMNRVTSLWKISKVTNPATISRNFMSSAILADFGGLSPWKPSGAQTYARTIAGFAGRNPASVAMLEEAKKMGLFNAGYNSAELNALATSYMASKDPNPLVRVLDGIKGAVDRSGVGTLYGSVDNFYKGALYTHGRTVLKMSPQEAARYAKKYAIDYSDVSPFVRRLREIPLGSPFVTFASKAIPLTIETAVKHPIRFWKYPAIAYGANELSRRSFGEEDRAEAVKLAEMGRLKSPRYIQLPGKGLDGRFRFLDLGYILPFGDMIEAYDKYIGGGAGDSNISFEPLGGPVQPLMEIAFNKSLFTGQPIWKETDTLAQKAAKISDLIGKSLLPAWAPPIPGTGFRGGYSTEAFRKAFGNMTGEVAALPGETPMPTEDLFGRTRKIGPTIASKIFGIDIKTISTEDVIRAGQIHVAGLEQELQRETGRIGRLKISEEQRKKELQIITEKYKALEAEIRRTFGMDAPQVNKAKNAAATGWNDSLGILK